MKINSKQKGASFERRIAKKLREYGYECRRGQQYSGANGDADVIGLDGIHIECKAQETMRLYDWMDQAKRDAKNGRLPTVIHKKNNCDILVTMRLEDWIKLYADWDTTNVLEFRE